MVTLANLQGGSLVADITGALQRLDQFQGRKREEREEEDLAGQIEIILGGGQPAQDGQVPKGTTGILPSKDGVGILGRLAPGLAQIATKITQSRDPAAADEFRQQAINGLQLRDELAELPDFASKQRRLAEEGAKINAEGGDINRIVELSNKSEPELDLELQKMDMIGKGMLEAVPEARAGNLAGIFDNPATREAFAKLQASNPAIAGQILQARQNEISRADKERARQRSAGAAAAAARRKAEEPKSELGKQNAALQSDIDNEIIDPVIGAELQELNRTRATAQDGVREDVFNAEGVLIGQKDPLTNELFGLPTSFQEPDVPTAQTDIGKAKQDFDNGFIDQDQFDMIVEAPEDKRADLTKLVEDRNSAISTFGEDSEQVAAIDEVISQDRQKNPPKLSDVASLRKSFIAQSGDFVIMRDSIDRVQTAADRATAAGDLALIFNFMKIQDPNSVVRESEFATAQNATSLPGRLGAAAKRVVNGERMTDFQRADFVDTANALFQTGIVNQRDLEQSFSDIARRNSINPADAFVDFIGDRTATEPPPAEVVDPNEGRTATNPRTGKTKIFRNGQWQDL